MQWILMSPHNLSGYAYAFIYILTPKYRKLQKRRAAVNHFLTYVNAYTSDSTLFPYGLAHYINKHHCS